DRPRAPVARGRPRARPARLLLRRVLLRAALRRRVGRPLHAPLRARRPPERAATPDAPLRSGGPPRDRPRVRARPRPPAGRRTARARLSRGVRRAAADGRALPRRRAAWPLLRWRLHLADHRR